MEFSLSLRVEENRIRALLKGAPPKFLRLAKGERPKFSCFLRGTPHILPLAKGELEGVEFWRLLKKGGRKQ